MKKVILYLLFSISYYTLTAQTCCSAGAPITSSFDIGTSDANQSIGVQLDYEYNSVNRLIDNNRKLRNDPRNRSGHNILFKTDFNINKHWAVSAFIPLVIQSRTTFSEEENATGIGDLSLLGQFTQYFGQDYQLKWSGGIKLPTGKQYISDDRGIILSPDMQSGSGTIDFFGRIALVKQHTFIRNLTNQTAISYRYNTVNNHFGDPEKIAGRQFKFGNETIVNSAFSYSFVVNSLFVIPELGVTLRHTSPNQEQGIDASNSGGYWIRIPLGVQLKTIKNFSIRLHGEIPIKEFLDGLQITTNYKLGLQLRYQIPFNKSNKNDLLILE